MSEWQLIQLGMTIGQVAATLGFIWWLAKALRKDIRELEKRHSELKDEVHTNYVRREELNRTEDRILKAIENLGREIKETSTFFINDILRRLDNETR